MKKYYLKVSNKIFGPLYPDKMLSLLANPLLDLNLIKIRKEDSESWVNVAKELIGLGQLRIDTIDCQIESLPADNVIPLKKKVSVVADVHERRNEARHRLRLKAVFRLGKIVFRSFTKDISLGGLKLEKEIPVDFRNQEVDVFISSVDGQMQIRFTAKIVESSYSSDQIQFQKKEGATRFPFEILRNWFAKIEKTNADSVKRKIA